MGQSMCSGASDLYVNGNKPSKKWLTEKRERRKQYAAKIREYEAML